MVRLAVVNGKGGTGKTTTCIYLSCGLAGLGRTLLIDTDPQKSATSWSAAATDFPADVVPVPADVPRRRLAALGRGYAHVIIDTPPADLPVIRSVVTGVDLVIVPVAPTGLDIRQLEPTWRLLASVRPEPEVGVLLCRIRRGTVAARTIRPILAEAGYPLLDTGISLSERYAGSFGQVPRDLGQYADLIKELL